MFQWPHFPSLIVRELLLFYLFLLVDDQGSAPSLEPFFADLHSILTISLEVIADNNREVLKAPGDNYTRTITNHFWIFETQNSKDSKWFAHSGVHEHIKLAVFFICAWKFYFEILRFVHHRRKYFWQPDCFQNCAGWINLHFLSHFLWLLSWFFTFWRTRKN